MRLSTTLIVLSAPLWGCRPTLRCSDDTEDCVEVEGGRYLFSVPESMERGSVDVLVFFHGYNSSAQKMRSRGWMRTGLEETGVLGVFPDGVDNTWAHQGSPSQARQELPFICLLYTSPSPRDRTRPRMPSSA